MEHNLDLYVIETLYSCDKSRNGWVNVSEVQHRLPEHKSEKDVKRSLKYWLKKGLVKSTGSENFKINREGIQFVEQRNLSRSIMELDNSIDNMKVFQAKSSAVETVFTVSLLGFAYLQLTAQGGQSNIAIALVVGTITWALLIGGKNLSEVTENEIIKKKNWLLTLPERIKQFVG